MIKNKQIHSASSIAGKTEYFVNLAEAAAKQAEIRQIAAAPIPNEEMLGQLCMYLLLDTHNIVIVDLDHRKRVQHITSVPLCPKHALDDGRYVRAVLGNNKPHYRGVAIQIESTDEDIVEQYLDIIDHFSQFTDNSRTSFFLCHNFDVLTLREI